MQTSLRCMVRHLKIFHYTCNTCLRIPHKQRETCRGILYQCTNINLNRNYVIGNVRSTTSKMKLVSSVEDLKKYLDEEKPFYLKLLTNIAGNINYDDLSYGDAKLLLVCCGSSVVDSSKEVRNNVCQQIFKELLKSDKLDLDVCHTYIDINTENGVLLDCKQFLSQLKYEPNQDTFALLLKNVSEKGDIGQALSLLKLMQLNNISVTEEMFNQLVLAHTISGGCESGETVLKTMKSAQIPETISTRFLLLKGVLQRHNPTDVDNVIQKYPIDLTENQLLKLLEVLGTSGNISWLAKITPLYSNVNITRDFIKALEKVCIHLVHMDKSESALNIYEEFVQPESDQTYAFFLLREMLHLDVDIERIIAMAKYLHNNNSNNYCLEQLTELALRHNYTGAAWKLLENMSVLRPHFFWPLLVNSNMKDGETGIFNTLSKMVDMNVKIDYETLQLYVLPFCNLDDLKVLIKKLHNVKVSLKEAINSLIVVLLHRKNIKEAADLCNRYDVPIFGENLFKLICLSWITANDSQYTLSLLQKYCESNPAENDIVGDFLTTTLNFCKNDNDFKEYIKLLKLINEKKLKVSTTASENVHKLSSTRSKDLKIIEKIKDGVDMLLDFNKNPEPVYIVHPRHMTINELECHLIELQEKNMETRGVLRRLILLHANLGHFKRVNELREIFSASNYKETAGMKSSLMYIYVKQEFLDAALNIYNEMKVESHFKIDDFKVIDLATLLVKNGKYDEAIDILIAESVSKKVVNNTELVRNCWKLLSSYDNPEEQLKIFKILVEKGYCKPTNIILGPLVKIHLNRGNLEKSVNVYESCVSTYRCTPLQLEILKAVVKDQILLQKVLKATENVHGSVATQGVLIAALAENGDEKTLQKVLLENKMDVKNELQKRCERWVNEGKLEALQTLSRACERLSSELIDVNALYNCMFRIYNLKNDHKNALTLYEELLEKEVIIDSRIEQQLKKLKIDKIERKVNKI